MVARARFFLKNQLLKSFLCISNVFLGYFGKQWPPSGPSLRAPGGGNDAPPHLESTPDRQILKSMTYCHSLQLMNKFSYQNIDSPPLNIYAGIFSSKSSTLLPPRKMPSLLSPDLAHEN